MRNSFPKVENVLVIDSGTYKGRFIFPTYSADAKIYQDADTSVVGAINGNMDPLVRAHVSGDRNSEHVLINIRRVDGFTSDTVEVPVGIKNKVESYNTKLPLLRANQLNVNEELNTELQSEVIDLFNSLVSYFEN